MGKQSASGGGDVLDGGSEALLEAGALRDELQALSERVILLTEDNARLKRERVMTENAYVRAKSSLEVRGVPKSLTDADLDLNVDGLVPKLRMQVQQLERDKAALTSRHELAEKRYLSLLRSQEKTTSS